MELARELKASKQLIINQMAPTSRFEMCLCYPYAQGKCPIMNQRSLFGIETVGS